MSFCMYLALAGTIPGGRLSEEEEGEEEREERGGI